MSSAGSDGDRPVVEVDGLSKWYTRDFRRSLRYALDDVALDLSGRGGGRSVPRPGEFAALEDVSFSLSRGEGLAVVGANGSGKSTLLKLLYGLIKPDAGTIRIRGRVGALIELGAGFNPVLTGRENVELMAQVAGLQSSAMHKLLDSIIEFAEIDDAIDTPVRYYSSGMRSRLAFAVSAQLRPDVLLVDEALAVGDLAFQRKCISHMIRFVNDGGALIFVSHSPYQQEALCARGLLLAGGRLVLQGSTAEVIGEHLGRQLGGEMVPTHEVVPDSRHPVVINNVDVKSKDGAELVSGASAQIHVDIVADRPYDVVLLLTIWTADQLVCLAGAAEERGRRIEAGPNVLAATIPRLSLIGGGYTLRLAILDARTHIALAKLGYEDPAVVIDVAHERSRIGNTMLASGQQLMIEDVEWS
jgi:lipopolysaccharide transport system ATP-binding protein